MDSQACTVPVDQTVDSIQHELRGRLEHTPYFSRTATQEIHVAPLLLFGDRTAELYDIALRMLLIEGAFDHYRVIHHATRSRTLDGNTSHITTRLDTPVVIVVRQRDPRQAGEGDGPS